MVQIAFVVSDSHINVDAATLAQRVRNQFGVEKVEPLAPSDGIVEIKIDGVTVMIAPMGAAYPTSDLDSLPGISVRGWASGKRPDFTNKDHAILTVVGEHDEKKAAAALTVAAAALCVPATCVGVMWGPSEEFVHPSHIASAAKEAFSNAPPTTLWINTLPYQTKDGFGLTTQGLSTFIGRELHFLPHREYTLEDLLGFSLDVSDYLFEKGGIIQNGDTLDFSDTSNLRARWVDENVDGEKEPLHWIELSVEPASRN